MPLVLTFLILIAVFIIIVLSTIKFEIVDFELSNIIQITPKNYKIKLKGLFCSPINFIDMRF